MFETKPCQIPAEGITAGLFFIYPLITAPQSLKKFLDIEIKTLYIKG
jgi:hypothetical protein